MNFCEIWIIAMCQKFMPIKCYHNTKQNCSYVTQIIHSFVAFP